MDNEFKNKQCPIDVSLWIFVVSLLAAFPVSARTFFTGGGHVAIQTSTSDAFLYYDTPTTEVAYNTQIIKSSPSLYHTVYHAEPKKPVGFFYPGDSLKSGTQSGSFSYAMPGNTAYRIHSTSTDPLSILYSAHSYDPYIGWGGAGNPMVVKEASGDYYHTLFLGVADDNFDRAQDDYRHYLLQARTLDFQNFELRTELYGQVQWQPFTPANSEAARRARTIQDATGNTIMSRLAVAPAETQGLIGSMVYDNGLYHFFYTDVDIDGRTYLFHRQTTDIASLDPTATPWTAAQKVNNEILQQSTVIRVAKAKDMDRWVVYYNGYRPGASHIEGDLFLQYTENLSIIGNGGLSSLDFFDYFVPGPPGPNSAYHYGVNEEFYLNLQAGGNVFAQHSWMTDPFGNLAIPDNLGNITGGLLTWSDFSTGIYSGDVYGSPWDAIDLLNALSGDADLDNDVDLSDLSVLAAHYALAAGGTWNTGDFDFDGDVDLSDLSALASNYGQGTTQAYADFQSLASVPEPVIGLHAFVLSVFGAVRRR
jgi:hypothetical protein